MRYVIAVVFVTLYVLYEQMYNDWDLTESIVAEVSRVLRIIGL